MNSIQSIYCHIYFADLENNDIQIIQIIINRLNREGGDANIAGIHYVQYGYFLYVPKFIDYFSTEEWLEFSKPFQELVIDCSNKSIEWLRISH